MAAANFRVTMLLICQDFTGRKNDELTFKAGDILVGHFQEGAWWRASVNGKRGIAPGNYVEKISPAAAKRTPPTLPPKKSGGGRRAKRGTMLPDEYVAGQAAAATAATASPAAQRSRAGRHGSLVDTYRLGDGAATGGGGGGGGGGDVETGGAMHRTDSEMSNIAFDTNPMVRARMDARASSEITRLGGTPPAMRQRPAAAAAASPPNGSAASPSPAKPGGGGGGGGRGRPKPHTLRYTLLAHNLGYGAALLSAWMGFFAAVWGSSDATLRPGGARTLCALASCGATVNIGIYTLAVAALVWGFEYVGHRSCHWRHVGLHC